MLQWTLACGGAGSGTPEWKKEIDRWVAENLSPMPKDIYGLYNWLIKLHGELVRRAEEIKALYPEYREWCRQHKALAGSPAYMSHPYMDKRDQYHELLILYKNAKQQYESMLLDRYRRWLRGEELGIPLPSPTGPSEAPSVSEPPLISDVPSTGTQELSSLTPLTAGGMPTVFSWAVLALGAGVLVYALWRRR